MQVQMWGVGTKSSSPAITAQRRINMYVDVRKEQDKTSFALIGRPGLTQFANISASRTRGVWAVNSLSTPVLFVVQNNIVYSVNNAGIYVSIGTIGTYDSDVTMVDDGRYLVLVDGVNGYYYNMLTPAGLIKITDGNFSTSPDYVTWQDTYFIVVSSATNQFQLSNNNDPSTWPAINIGATQSIPGGLQAAIGDHAVLNVFGSYGAEFWQDTGAPDFPYALIPGSAQEFGLTSPQSLAKFDNSLVGLFQNKMGALNVSRLQGFSLRRLSNEDIEQLLADNKGATITADAYAVQWAGHPMYVMTLESANLTLAYDGATGIWSELQGYGKQFSGYKYSTFVTRQIVGSFTDGKLYYYDNNSYMDGTDPVVREVWSKHIWNENKYIGISWLQVDVESGTGTVTGAGNSITPALDLQVSKDGGNSFQSVGYSTIGQIGDYTKRVFWSSLGAARDWVLKLRITDPNKIVITNAVAEMTGAPF